MGKRINRCVELLGQDQAIYYDGPHSGHVLTHAQGRTDMLRLLQHVGFVPQAVLCEKVTPLRA